MDSGRPESVTQERPYRKKCFAKIALVYKGKLPNSTLYLPDDLTSNVPSPSTKLKIANSKF